MRRRLPRVNGRQVRRALERAGFHLVRINGSHHFMEHDTDPTRSATVPIHGSHILSLSVIRNILRTTKLSVTEFIQYL